ncbi:MAG: hypothetical protein V3R80_12745, partial [Candidatus Tectomicrobia bacterium]
MAFVLPIRRQVLDDSYNGLGAFHRLSPHVGQMSANISLIFLLGESKMARFGPFPDMICSTLQRNVSLFT